MRLNFFIKNLNKQNFSSPISPLSFHFISLLSQISLNKPCTLVHFPLNAITSKLFLYHNSIILTSHVTLRPSISIKPITTFSVFCLYDFSAASVTVGYFFLLKLSFLWFVIPFLWFPPIWVVSLLNLPFPALPPLSDQKWGVPWVSILGSHVHPTLHSRLR